MTKCVIQLRWGIATALSVLVTVRLNFLQSPVQGFSVQELNRPYTAHMEGVTRNVSAC